MMISTEEISNVRKPLEEAKTLPPLCYYSQEFYDLEVENIFRKKWLLMGRADEWAQAGTYKSFNYFGIPFFIVKDQSGTIHAFANSCRHRGAEMVRGEGTTGKLLVCPYHSWSYELNGKLRGAPGMEKTSCFSKDQYGLAEVRLEIWNSFVFVNFSADAPPLAKQLGNLDEYLSSYDFDNVVTVGRDEYVVNTNWKALVENSMEWLHHATVHKQSIAGKVATIQRNIVVGDPGEYLLVQSLAQGASRATLESDKGFPPVSTLRGPALQGSQYVLLYPYSMLGCDVDSIWFKQMLPEGPNRVRNIATYCFHKETVARPDFDTVKQAYFRRFQKVVKEDNEAMELQLAGLMSPLAQPGPYSDREILVHRIDNWVLDHILPAMGNRAGIAAQ